MVFSDHVILRIGPFTAKIWVFSELDQGGLLQHNIQSDFVSMVGCTNSLNKGPIGTSSSTKSAPLASRRLESRCQLVSTSVDI